jgi:hypothetical protein
MAGDPRPTGAEAMDEPLQRLPVMVSAHRVRSLRQGADGQPGAPNGTTPIRDIIAKMRHDGCGGRAGKEELLTGIEGVSSRPMRKIVLLGS